MKIFDAIIETCDHIIRYYEKNEDDILQKSGAVFGVLAVISAAVATHKCEKIIKKAKEDIDEIHETERYSDVTEQEVSTEIVKVTAVAGLKVAAIAAVPVLMETKSINDYNHCINNKNADIARWSAIAGTAITQLNELRRRAIARYGKEAEEELYYGVRKKTIQTIENGKTKKSKGYVIEQEPVNHNIICFAPWTSSLYCDEEKLDCPGTNMNRIKGVFKTLNVYLSTSSEPFISTNMIASEFGIKAAAEWYTEGIIHGEGAVTYHVQTVYEEWEGRKIPIYYIEVNTLPNLPERLSAVLPEAPIYSNKDQDYVPWTDIVPIRS